MKADHEQPASIAEAELAILLKIAEEAWATRAEGERRETLADIGYQDEIPGSFPKAALESAFRAGQYRIFATFEKRISRMILPFRIRIRRIWNSTSTDHHSPGDGFSDWPNSSIQGVIDTLGPHCRAPIYCVLKVALMRLATRLENGSGAVHNRPVISWLQR